MPDAAVLFFNDSRWWKKYEDPVRKQFRGAIVSTRGSLPGVVKVTKVPVRDDKPVRASADGSSVTMSRSSTTAAIHLGLLLNGGSDVVVLGLDGQLDESGRRHCHGEAYPWSLKKDSYRKQAREMERIAPEFAKIGKVLNASPRTKVTAFAAVDLEAYLAKHPDPDPVVPVLGKRGTSAPEEQLVKDFERGGEAMPRFLSMLPEGSRILDVGSGLGEHAEHMRSRGHSVVTLDLGHPADISSAYQTADVGEPFDGIWMSHVLEHQPDPNEFLRKAYRDLKVGGVLAVTVPPLKEEIVGGHVTLWNEGLLLYQAILAGFDCSAARVGRYGYNISLIVGKQTSDPLVVPGLVYDKGDIERLAPFFPLPVKQGFNGRLGKVNW